MAQKKARQTFEKLKREQAVKEKRARKQERRAAARLAKLEGGDAPVDGDVDAGLDANADVGDGDTGARADDETPAG